MLIGVTGASGFIGRQLVEDLLRSGHALRVLSRKPRPDANKDSAGNAQEVSGDLLQPSSLEAFCQGCDVIVHLAALAHVTNTRAEDHEQSTLTGTGNLLKAMKDTGVNKLVFISSIKASADPKASAYARTKAAAEVLVREAGTQGLNGIILRPAIVYGPGMKGNLAAWMRKIRRGRAPRLPAVSTTLQMISREDVCKAIVIGLNQVSPQAAVHVLHDNKAYGINILEQILRSASQVKLPAVALPKPCWWLAAKAGDLLFALTGKSPGFSSHSYRTLFCQDELAINTLPGFQPEYAFDDALPAILEALDKP